MSEQQVQAKIIKYLESKSYYVVKIITCNKRGVPDILFMKDGKFCAIEVKDKGKKSKVTELQQFHLALINNTGGTAIVADCVEDVKEVF